MFNGIINAASVTPATISLGSSFTPRNATKSFGIWNLRDDSDDLGRATGDICVIGVIPDIHRFTPKQAG
jgi:hypothetical protein